MMLDESFSIITPVYNSFHSINRLIKSLENQTYKNFEVIFIDDCSTDDSYENLVALSKNTNINVKVLKTLKNSGPGNARNIGLYHAKNTWITFIDADDWIESDFLERITLSIKQSSSECFIVDYYMDWKNKSIKCSSILNASQGEVALEQCFKEVRNLACAKVFHRNIVDRFGLEFPNLRRGEDIAFTGILISYCTKIYYIKDPLYHYTQHENSLSNTIEYDDSDLIKSYKFLQERMNQNYIYLLKDKSIHDVLYGCTLIRCKTNESKTKILEFIEEYENVYQDWFNSNIVKKSRVDKHIFFILIRYKLIVFMRLYAKLHSLLF